MDLSPEELAQIFSNFAGATAQTPEGQARASAANEVTQGSLRTKAIEDQKKAEKKAKKGSFISKIGSTLGSLLGQALIPIPGVGAAIGGTIGGTLGAQAAGSSSSFAEDLAGFAVDQGASALASYGTSKLADAVDRPGGLIQNKQDKLTEIAYADEEFFGGVSGGALPLDPMKSRLLAATAGDPGEHKKLVDGINEEYAKTARGRLSSALRSDQLADLVNSIAEEFSYAPDFGSSPAPRGLSVANQTGLEQSNRQDRQLRLEEQVRARQLQQDDSRIQIDQQRADQSGQQVEIEQARNRREDSLAPTEQFLKQSQGNLYNAEAIGKQFEAENMQTPAEALADKLLLIKAEEEANINIRKTPSVSSSTSYNSGPERYSPIVILDEATGAERVVNVGDQTGTPPALNPGERVIGGIPGVGGSRGGGVDPLAIPARAAAQKILDLRAKGDIQGMTLYYEGLSPELQAAVQGLTLPPETVAANGNDPASNEVTVIYDPKKGLVQK